IAPSAWRRADLRDCSCPAPHTIPLEWSEGEEAFVGRCTESDHGCDLAEELLVRYLTAAGEPQAAPDERTAHVDVDLRLLFRFVVDLDGSEGARFGILSHTVRNEIDVDPQQKPYAVTGDGSHEIRLADAATSEA
ncbi:MAG: hypothetical protein ACRDGR_09060, partial [bacterium]